MSNHFRSIINQFRHHKILVIGESFLDGYFYGITERINREAPVPIVDIQNRNYTPGGAANTAVNTATLTGKTIYLSVLGNDIEGAMLKKALEDARVDTSCVIIASDRETIAKKRIFADGQMLIRFDSGTTKSIHGVVEEKLIDQLISLWSEVDGIIISDYGYGILTDTVISTIEKLQRSMHKVLVIDSKYLDRYRKVQATAVKPNYKEAVALLGLTRTERGGMRIDQIIQQKEELLERTNATIAAVTLDAEGALIFQKGGQTYRTYAERIENPKVVGAGDTYVSALTLSFSAGADIKTAAEIAAAATKVIIKKQGTAFCSAAELHASFTSNEKFITDRKQLLSLVTDLKKQNKKIVFTNGCFDILHSGHVIYLNQAKSFGDVLILGLNTDESIRAIKGQKRPINALHDRMQVLSALSSVTYIVPIPEKTANELVTIIQPDTYVKGGDYTQETLPEAHIVMQYGGKIEIIPTFKGKSTTSIIRRIQYANTQIYH